MEARRFRSAVLWASCIACAETTPAVDGDAGSPLPALELSVAPVTVVRGESTTVFVAAKGAFEGQQPLLAFSSLPPGVSAASVPVGAAPATALVVSAALDAPIADVRVEVVALVGDVVVGSTAVDLAVSNVDGSLDPTFGRAGVMLGIDAQTPLFGIGSLPDGRWIIGGYRSGGQIVLARLLPDGSFDPAFGTNGVLATDVGGGVPFVSNMASDGAGDVAVHAERVDMQNSVRDEIAVFDVDGKVTSTAEFAAFTNASDGAGGFSGASWFGGAVSHIDASGTVFDATGDGVSYPAVAALGGATFVAGTTSSSVGVAKFVLTGSALVRDATFASPGFPVSVDYRPNATAVAVDASGRVLVGMAGSGKLSLGALMPSGAIDTSFGSGGVCEIAAGKTTSVVAVSPLSSDALVVGTVGDANGGSSIALARLSSSGGSVLSFGTFGRTLSHVGFNDAAIGAALGAGRLCVVGSTTLPTSTSFVACYRVAP